MRLEKAAIVRFCPKPVAIDVTGTRLMVIRWTMSETDDRQDERHSRGGAAPPKDLLEAENVSLRLLLAQVRQG